MRPDAEVDICDAWSHGNWLIGCTAPQGGIIDKPRPYAMILLTNYQTTT